MSFRVWSSPAGLIKLNAPAAATRVVKLSARNTSTTSEYEDKQIVDKPTPYEKANRQCILCKNKIQLDYKNPRLLAQFVSPLNGRAYDKHITGLCEKQQTILEVESRKARIAMHMPIFHKDPKFNRDPALFNPDKPQRPNPH